MPEVLQSNRRKTPHRSFDAVLIEAVDEALKELGDSACEVVYFQVARNYSIKREEIPRRFDEFLLAVRREFGSGSKTVEALILEKLFGKLGSSSNGFQAAAATMILLSTQHKQNVGE